MGDLFTNFNIPDQYLQSTVNTGSGHHSFQAHLEFSTNERLNVSYHMYPRKAITFFTIACKAEITSGRDGIERAIIQLATSRDTTVHITMVESLLEITSGYSLSKTTHLKKDETTLWERAKDLLVQAATDEKRTVSLFTGMAAYCMLHYRDLYMSFNC